MATPKVSIALEAQDLFTPVFRDMQDELKALQGDFNKTSTIASSAFSGGTQSADKLTDSLKSVSGETTTLASTMKEVASLMIAAFSVDKLIAFTKASFEASLAMDAINSKLKVLTGSQEAASAEWEFVRQTAQKLGLDLQQTAEAYSSFAVATKGTSLEGKKARDVFISLSEAATALHLPAEQTSRVMYQLQQMLSKGKVNMEDLKTASESFPGLMKQLADGMGITTTALMAQMQAGTLMADEALPKLAEQLHKTYGSAAVEAADKGRGALNRFNTAVFEFKLQFGQATSGAAESVIKFGTTTVEWFGEIIRVIQRTKIWWSGLFEKIGAFVNAGGIIGLMTGGKDAVDELKLQFEAIDAEVEASWKKTLNLSKTGSDQIKQDDEKSGKARRDNAKKTGEDLVKINSAYAKQVGDEEAQLTAEFEKEYQERLKATQDYYDQKKAASKDNGEELAWEKIKKAKLKELENQHAQDITIIKAKLIASQADRNRIALDNEIDEIRKQAADRVVTERQAEDKITLLTLAAKRDQYSARKTVADKILAIYGRDSQEYKAALKEQETAHKEYTSANLTAYTKYASEIKKLDQGIIDFRKGIEEKIADLKQRNMTESQKYADNERRYAEAVSKAKQALDKGDYENYLKYEKEAETLVGKLADKKVDAANKVQQIEIDHQNKLKELQVSNTTGKLTDQQKLSADIAKENLEYQQKIAAARKEEATTQEGLTNAEKKYNELMELGTQAREKQKTQYVDTLAKLKEINEMKIDPKTIETSLDQGALSAVKSTISDLTKPETKIIYIKNVQGETIGAHNKGYFAGGKVASGSPLRDSVSAMLAKDEWVINNRATRFWGDDFLAGINNPISAMGQRIRSLMSVGQPALAGAANMGTINLSIGNESFPVQAGVDVIGQLTTAIRRARKAKGL